MDYFMAQKLEPVVTHTSVPSLTFCPGEGSNMLTFKLSQLYFNRHCKNQCRISHSCASFSFHLFLPPRLQKEDLPSLIMHMTKVFGFSLGELLDRKWEAVC